jgi:hypothetical protein
MTVVTPQYEQYALLRHGVQVELPRLQVDTSAITVFTRTINVGPALPIVTGVSYKTTQAAIDYCVANDIAGNTQIIAVVTPYAATVTHRARTAGKGYIVLTPAVVPLAPGVRATPANVAAIAALMPQISIEAPGGMVVCENDAYGYRWVGWDFAVPVPALGTITEIFAGVYIAVNAPTSLSSFPHHIGFDRCIFRSLDPVNTRLRKTVTQECPYFFLESCYVADAHDYPDGVNNGGGNGDTNALSTSSFAGGPAKCNNTFFSGAGEVILVGGADPQFYDAKSRDVTFTHNLVFKDPAWMGLYPVKNNFEHKSSARWLIEGNIFDGSWEGGQDGTGIAIGSVNQGQTVATNWEGIRDFAFRLNFCRNMTIWAIFNGINYLNAEVLNGISVHDVVGANIHPVGYGEDSNHLLATGGGISRFVLEQCTVLAPEARSTRFANVNGYPEGYHTNPQSYLRRNIVTCGSYGINVDGVGNGKSAMDIVWPDDDLRENVFIAKAGSSAEDGIGYPPLSYYPKTYAAVGFVDYPGAEAIWATGDPDTICAKLTLAGSSPYKAITSDGTDPGADMTAVRAAIAGVWTGTAGNVGGGGGGGGITIGAEISALVVVRAASTARARKPFTVQPIVKAVHEDGTTATEFTGIITAFKRGGRGTLTGTLDARCVAGVASWTNLGSTLSAPMLLGFYTLEVDAP